MSNLWNSYGNQSLNGLNYQAPDGFEDRGFDYVFPDPLQFVPGAVVIPAGQTVEYDQFTDSGSIFVWFGLELPPPAQSGSPYAWLASVQIYIDEELVWTDALNTDSGFGNQSVPLPIFPRRMVRPGALIRVVLTNNDVVDYLNFAVVLRGLRRYQIAAPGGFGA
jgi:hypothetical protein